MKHIHRFIILLCSLAVLSGSRIAVGASVPGDVNADGAFDALDISLSIQAYVTSNPGLLARPDLGDVAPDPTATPRGYGDGQIRSNDLNRLVRALIGVQTLRPVPTLQINNVSVGKDLQDTSGGALSIVAPAGNVPVTITSSDPAKVLLSKSANTPGSASINLSVGAGSQNLPAFYVQALTDSGTAQLTATVPGYDPGESAVSFTPSGFTIATGAISTTFSSPDTTVTLRLAKLAPTTFSIVTPGTLRSGLSVNVPISSTDPTVGTMVTSPVAFNGGDTQAGTLFHPVGGGTAQIQITQPNGFSVPASQTEIQATVTAPAMTLSAPSGSVGKDLQTTAGGYLSAPAPAGNLPVTISSSDPTKVLLSKTADTPGSASIVISVGAGSTNFPAFYVQALADSGSIQITATAPGFTKATDVVALAPSGFALYANDFSTTTFSTNTNLNVFAAVLNPTTLNYSTYQQVRAGIGPVNVGVTSDTTSVGTIVTSPVAFNGGDYVQSTSFHPLGAGSAVIHVVQPAGFSTPNNYQSVTATVTAPNIPLGDLTVGKDLQVATNAYLEAPAPTGGVTVTVQVADPTKARLSKDPALLGDNTGSVSFDLPAGQTYVPTIYVQALVGTGTVTYTASAPGYTSGTGTVTLVPSGFVLAANDFSTTTFSANPNLNVFAVALDPTTLNYVNLYQPLRAGIGPVNVGVTSDTTSVGTITVSPLAFNTQDYYQTTAFHPVSAGTTVLNIVQPAGFSTPSNYQSVTATVSAPNINPGDLTVGKDLQVGTNIYLEAPAPAGGVTVTIQVADPTKARLSKDPALLGDNTGALSFDLPAGQTYVPTFYVQALAGTGTVAYTASAPGYTSGTGTITLLPSGFALLANNFDTTTFSTNTNLNVFAVALDPTTLNYVNLYQPLRAGIGPVNVGVTSDTTSVGTITVSPLAFNTQDYYQTTAFHPVSVGSTVLHVVQPAGFSTPSNYQSVTATVSAPNINPGDLTVGKDLQVGTNIYLEAPAPAGGVTVTIQVADPTKARISKDPALLGDNTGALSFDLPAGQTYVPTIYVQALVGTGSVQISASAPGYANGTGTVTLVPSGFVLLANDFSTTTSSTNTNLNVFAVALDPTTLNYVNLYQPLRAGIGPVNVGVTSDTTSVGTITVSPLAFNTQDYYQTTAFHPVSAGTTVLNIVQPAGFSTPSNYQSVTATVGN